MKSEALTHLSRGLRILWTSIAIGLLPTASLQAQSEVEPISMQVNLIDNTDAAGGQFAFLQGLAPPEGVALNMPYAAITAPIQMIVVNETPDQGMAVEIFDSTGGQSATGIIALVPEGATATFRVEGEYSVQINATGDVPVPYTFLLWVMPDQKQLPDSIYTIGEE